MRMDIILSYNIYNIWIKFAAMEIESNSVDDRRK